MKILEITKLYEEFDIRPTKTVDARGNPMGYEVFDKDSPRSSVQTFTGSDAEGKAEEFRDRENAKLRQRQQPTQQQSEPKPTDDKPKKRFRKTKAVLKFIAKGGVAGSFFGALAAVGEVINVNNAFERLEKLVSRYGCNPTDRLAQVKINEAKKDLRTEVYGSVENVLIAFVGGGLSAAAAARLFTPVPGWGWLVGLVGGFAGTFLLTKLRDYLLSEPVITSIGDWLAGDMIVFVEDKCNPVNSSMYSENTIQESEAEQKLKAVGNKLKDIVKNDPELMKKIKQAKQAAS